MWDFGSGQEIRSWVYWSENEKEEDVSIASMLYCEVQKFDDPKPHRCLAVLGWNNKVKLLEVSA